MFLATDRSDTAASVLAVRGISKRYGATDALRDASLELKRGQVYGLIGVNGSGKSTLMKLVAGAERATAGEMLLNGRPYRPRSVAHATKMGVGMVPQELPIVRSMTVADNLFIGQWHARFGVVNTRRGSIAAIKALEELEVDVDPRMPARDLSLGEQQMVVIARTLARRPQLVLMDEPTSALGSTEVTRLRKVVRGIADRGDTVLMVSQRLDDVFAVCDHVTVLHRGESIVSAAIGQLSSDRAIDLMLYGREGSCRPSTTKQPDVSRSALPHQGDPGSALKVKGLRGGTASPSVDLQVRSGEIVGLAGLPGSGPSRVLRALFGRESASAAEMTLFGELYVVKGPSACIRQRVAYVTGDRQIEGLIPDSTVATNIAMVGNRAPMGGPVHLRRMRKKALEQIEMLRIRPGDPDLPVRDLSGGNQQKVVFARWMLSEPRLWLLDDATRGVDIGARRDMHAALRSRAREDGSAVIATSSDLLELFELCDRIVAFRAGSIVLDAHRDDTTPDAVEAVTTGAIERTA